MQNAKISGGLALLLMSLESFQSRLPSPSRPATDCASKISGRNRAIYARLGESSALAFHFRLTDCATDSADAFARAGRLDVSMPDFQHEETKKRRDKNPSASFLSVATKAALSCALAPAESALTQPIPNITIDFRQMHSRAPTWCVVVAQDNLLFEGT
jgi:hypothetical protein